MYQVELLLIHRDWGCFSPQLQHFVVNRCPHSICVWQYHVSHDLGWFHSKGILILCACTEWNKQTSTERLQNHMCFYINAVVLTTNVTQFKAAAQNHWLELTSLGKVLDTIDQTQYHIFQKYHIYVYGWPIQILYQRLCVFKFNSSLIKFYHLN